MLFGNNIRLLLRGEGQLISVVNILARSLHTTFVTRNTDTERTKIKEILQYANPTNEDWNQVFNWFTTGERSHVLSPYIEIIKSIQATDETGLALKALSLFEHLKKIKYQPNVAEKLLYMKLCITNKRFLCQHHKEDLARLHDEIISSSPYVESKMYITCMEALSLTDRWMEIQSVIEDEANLERHGKLRGRLYSCLADAYFRNNRFDKGWSCIRKAHERNLSIEHRTYKDYVNICNQNKLTFRTNIEKMFQLWGEYCVTPTKEVIAEYVKVFRKLGINAWYTNIMPNGNCSRCNKLLRTVQITPTELKTLADTVLNHLVVGSNVYLQSNPKELAKLHEFIEKSKPYNVVLDGLNVLYKINDSGMQRQKNMVRALTDLQKGAKGAVVVLRRYVKHKKQFMELLKDTKVFYVDDLSEDDPFLLYIAWNGEPDTKFVSGDIVRDHKARLPDHISRMTFTKWMLSRRYNFRGNGTLIHPPQYDQVAQAHGNTWHVPFTKSNEPASNSFLNLEKPLYWVCFQFN